MAVRVIVAAIATAQAITDIDRIRAHRDRPNARGAVLNHLEVHQGLCADPRGVPGRQGEHVLPQAQGVHGEASHAAAVRPLVTHHPVEV